MRCARIDKYKTAYTDGFCQEVSFERIAEESDIISLMYLDARNAGNGERYYFDNLKKNYLINLPGRECSLSALASAMDAVGKRGCPRCVGK